MPNHVHMIIIIDRGAGGRPQVAPTVSRIIKQFKGVLSKKAGFSLWLRSFHDHIIRIEREYAEVWNYIDTNPMKWEIARYYQGISTLWVACSRPRRLRDLSQPCRMILNIDDITNEFLCAFNVHPAFFRVMYFEKRNLQGLSQQIRYPSPIMSRSLFEVYPVFQMDLSQALHCTSVLSIHM